MAKTKEDSEYVEPPADKAAKAKYDSAVRKEKEDKNYSAWDTLKSAAKKAFGFKKGGSVKSHSRGDGCCIRGKTKGRML